jgi:hypothetical protein
MTKGFQLESAVGLAYAAAGLGLVYLIYKSGLFQVAGSVTETAVEAAGAVKQGVSNYGDFMAEKMLEKSWWEILLPNPFSDSYREIYGTGIKATSGYVVIRQRDFNAQWQISSTAYQAAKGMHSDNEKILKTYVLDGLKLKPSLQKIVKLTDFVVIRSNGEVQSA